MFDIIPTLDCAGRVLRLDRPRIMGIVNVTPDSFSDGGRFAQTDSAVAHALSLIEEGADVVDIGGESTRPGAVAVGESEELRRVLPVIERLVKETAVPISVDTSNPAVMRAALATGAGMINDVRALRAAGAQETVAASKAAVCLMHMQGDPCSMQEAPRYDDVVAEVHRFLAERIFACEMSGIAKKRIVVDVGFGFGKTLEHNYLLLRQLSRFLDLGVPLLVGLSRKSMIAAATGRGVDERTYGSVAAAVLAAEAGARLIRVHDVAATRDALAVWQATVAQPAFVAKKEAPKIVWPDE